MTDEKIYRVNVKPRKVEKTKLPDYGEVKGVHFKPKAEFEGLFVHEGRVDLWVSNDERRIMTKITANLPVASVKILLASVRGPGDDFWTKNGAKDLNAN
jgi:hypothetical protein